MRSCAGCGQQTMRPEAKFCDECGASTASVSDLTPALIVPTATPRGAYEADIAAVPNAFAATATTRPQLQGQDLRGHPQPQIGGHDQNGGRRWFVGATLLLLGVVSTATQYVTAAAFGLPIFSTTGRVWSTGGLVAVVASVYMGVKCRSWADFRRRIGVWMGLTVILAVGAVALIAGFNNAYSITVVDQEARAETFHREPTGRYSVKERTDRICGHDEDYLSCINQHVVLYNVVCKGNKLTADGSNVCTELDGFIGEIRKTYKTCGSGCETRAGNDGLWGWPYLQSVPETVRISNSDSLSEISHLEHCNFKLGPVKVGNCLDDREP